MATMDNLNPSQLLRSMGLMRPEETSYLPSFSDVAVPFAMFGAGVVLGAGLALILTPKTGRELRDDLSRQASKLQTAVRDRIPTRSNDRPDQELWENAPSQA